MLHIEQLIMTRRANDFDFQICLPLLSLDGGNIIILQGDSGCGKSTLLEIIGMILKPDNINNYQLVIGGDTIDIAKIIKQNQQDKLAYIRSRYFGFVPQIGGLLPFLTIKENILLPLQLLEKKVDNERLKLLTDKLDIACLLNKYPKQLSVGERQRSSFIRAIIHKPLLLLADEPTSALDPYNANMLFDLIIEQANIDNIAAIIVSHERNIIKNRKLNVLEPQLASKQKVIFSQTTKGERYG